MIWGELSEKGESYLAAFLFLLLWNLDFDSYYFSVQWYDVQKHALITTDDCEEAQKIKGSVDIDFMMKMYSK